MTTKKKVTIKRVVELTADRATVPTLTDILTERGKKYGAFRDHARVSNNLRGVLTERCQERGQHMSYSQIEALTMICHKMARIVNGDPNYIDSWDDIAGYATLVADELRGVIR
jgi:hypothetical protein